MRRCLALSCLTALAACGGDESPPTDADTTDADVSDTSPDATDAADVPADGSGEGVDPDGDGPIEYMRLEYELSGNAVVVEGALLAGLREYDPAVSEDLTFAADAPGASDLARGDVLVAGISDATPQGLLRTVESVESHGDELIVRTAPASIAAAFRSLDVEVRGAVPTAELFGGPSEKAGGGSSFTAPFGGDVNWGVFDGDGDYGTDEDQVRIFGPLEAWATFSFSFSFDVDVLGDINPFEIPPDLNPVDVDLEFNFGLDLGSHVDITAEGQASLSFEEELELGYLPLPAFGVWPLVFVPVLQAEGRVTGWAPGSFRANAGLDAGIGGGITFSVDDGFSPSISPPTYEPGEADADVEIGAGMRASVDVELALLLYGIMGPKAGIEAWARGWRDVDAVLPDLLRITAIAPRADSGMLLAADRDRLLWVDAAGQLQHAADVDVGSANALRFDGAATANDGAVVLATPIRALDGEPNDVAVLRVAPDRTVTAWAWGDPAWDEKPHELIRWGDGFALVVTARNFAESPDTVSWLLKLDAGGALAGAWRLTPCSGDEEVGLRAAVETDDGHVVLGGFQRFSAPRARHTRADRDCRARERARRGGAGRVAATSVAVTRAAGNSAASSAATADATRAGALPR